MTDKASPQAASTAGRPAAVSVIGVDPGLRRTGYAVLALSASSDRPRLIEAGVIRLQVRAALADRLLELDRSLAELLERLRPGALACEELYAHYKHPRTAILMGHARGVILASAARAGLEVAPVAATNVKKLTTGSGHASKRQMQLAVAGLLGLPCLPEPHDVADAIAIAICGARLLAARRIVERATGRGRVAAGGRS